MKHVLIGLALLAILAVSLSLMTQISVPTAMRIDRVREKENMLLESVGYPLDRSEFFRANIPSDTYRVLESTKVLDTTLVEGKSVAVQKYRFQSTRTAITYEVVTSLSVGKKLEVGQRVFVSPNKAEIQQ